ncbi:hypothetical protein K440DRAFT_308066 [Wilcoxina mikolae CBS 423.85]|nr:hypothetical protein K440DRAFT_308066 [Wilcoxina mikolae CBS 423.85]
MTNLEHGEFGSQQTLWEQEICYGQIVYRNKITGCKTELLPEPTYGGILADTMGLGKSLTTLATILGSLDTARSNVPPGDGSWSSIPHLNGMDRKHTAKTTLIVVPLSLLANWCEEIEKHVAKGSISVYRYHGPNRILDPMKLREFDIILTTYSTITWEHSNKNPPLESINFFRLVLDEAHIIRRHQTKQFSAIYSLSAGRRWCLTGTPIQNKLDDLQSLLRFLRLSPFDDGKTFDKHISGLLKANNLSGLQNLRMLLSSICLRRTTEVLQALPDITEEIRVLELSPEERRRYCNITEESKKQIDSLVCAGNAANAYQCILSAILRLRLLCNHGTFDVQETNPNLDSTNLPAPTESSSSMKKEASLTCSHCFSAVDSSTQHTQCPDTEASVSCFHTWCTECLSLHQSCLYSGQNGTTAIICPLCGKPVAEDTNIATPEADSGYGSPVDMDCDSQTGFSTKISAVINEIRGTIAEGKSIVFSYWTRTLNLLGNELSSLGMAYVRLDGSLNAASRKGVIDKFRGDPGVRILLMTTGAGAVGLNLTVANYIHLIEPQWNPMVETQAIGRAHQLGQQKPVTVFRYVTARSIEETVQSRRLMKLQLAELTLNAEDGAKAQVVNRIQSLRALL